ncbi:hypothetical protein AWB64_00866 [Caballeronia sordidicola]|uniref:Uncharacterized protein n=1 Tax=Caballeronia sordidicola TaxID=196367 RepID=A0A158F765_CABSO|nr:hypothetical protein AWB64_00866 [Caballeronia sordidicola]
MDRRSGLLWPDIAAYLAHYQQQANKRKGTLSC